MRMLTARSAWVVTVLALAGCATAFAQDEDERENLTDIREINVVVENLTDDAEAAGLTRRTLESTIERRLEGRRVPLGNSRNVADLYVSVDTHLGTTGLYAYCVEVAVQQLVTIEGNQLRTLADVWDVGSLGAVGTANLPRVEAGRPADSRQLYQRLSGDEPTIEHGQKILQNRWVVGSFQ